MFTVKENRVSPYGVIHPHELAVLLAPRKIPGRPREDSVEDESVMNLLIHESLTNA